MIRRCLCFNGNVTGSSKTVVIYIKDRLDADYYYSGLNSVYNESGWWKLRSNKSKKLVIGGIYKSPNTDIANLRALHGLNINEALGLTNKDNIITGDFNFSEIICESWKVNKMKPILHFSLTSASETLPISPCKF